MGKVVTNGTIEIGYECFKGVRKRPCICVKDGNVVRVLGTFKSNEDAEFFVDKLAEMTSAKEINNEQKNILLSDTNSKQPC